MLAQQTCVLFEQSTLFTKALINILEALVKFCESTVTECNEKIIMILISFNNEKNQ